MWSGGWWGCRGRRPSIRTSGCGRGSTGSRSPSWIRRSGSTTSYGRTLFRGTLHLVTAADYLRFRMTVAPVLEAGLKVLGERGAGAGAGQGGGRGEEVAGEGAVDVYRGAGRAAAAVPGRERAGARVLHPDAGAVGGLPNGRPLVLDGELPIHAGRGVDREEASASVRSTKELVTRYLQAFGPATPADFQTWSGLPKAKPLFDELELETFTDETGKTLYDVPDAPRPDPEDTGAGAASCRSSTTCCWRTRNASGSSPTSTSRPCSRRTCG